jgi:hypothetical protein
LQVEVMITRYVYGTCGVRGGQQRGVVQETLKRVGAVPVSPHLCLQVTIHCGSSTSIRPRSKHLHGTPMWRVSSLRVEGHRTSISDFGTCSSGICLVSWTQVARCVICDLMEDMDSKMCVDVAASIMHRFATSRGPSHHMRLSRRTAFPRLQPRTRFAYGNTRRWTWLPRSQATPVVCFTWR